MFFLEKILLSWAKSQKFLILESFRYKFFQKCRPCLRSTLFGKIIEGYEKMTPTLNLDQFIVSVISRKVLIAGVFAEVKRRLKIQNSWMEKEENDSRNFDYLFAI